MLTNDPCSRRWHSSAGDRRIELDEHTHKGGNQMNMLSIILVAAATSQVSWSSQGTVAAINDPQGWCAERGFVHVGELWQFDGTADLAFPNDPYLTGFGTVTTPLHRVSVGVDYSDQYPGSFTIYARFNQTGTWNFLQAGFERGRMGRAFIPWDRIDTNPPHTSYDDCVIDFEMMSMQMRLVGDSNGDGLFDSSDLIAAFVAGGYEDDIKLNSTFASGDWNADGEFTSADFIVAMKTGAYERPVAAVPEPTGLAAFLLGLGLVVHKIRRF